MLFVAEVLFDAGLVVFVEGLVVVLVDGEVVLLVEVVVLADVVFVDVVPFDLRILTFD